MLIKISETKAYLVEGIKIGDQELVSVRQMYATRKDPNFKPARQGVTIPRKEALRVAKALRALYKEGDFKEIKPSNS